jgi:hypothetical protein
MVEQLSIAFPLIMVVQAVLVAAQGAQMVTVTGRVELLVETLLEV